MLLRAVIFRFFFVRILLLTFGSFTFLVFVRVFLHLFNQAAQPLFLWKQAISISSNVFQWQSKSGNHRSKKAFQYFFWLIAQFTIWICPWCWCMSKQFELQIIWFIFCLTDKNHPLKRTKRWRNKIMHTRSVLLYFNPVQLSISGIQTDAMRQHSKFFISIDVTMFAAMTMTSNIWKEEPSKLKMLRTMRIAQSVCMNEAPERFFFLWFSFFPSNERFIHIQTLANVLSM